MAKEKAARHFVGISGAQNNISVTRELRGGEFVKGKRERREYSAQYANWASVRYS